MVALTSTNLLSDHSLGQSYEIVFSDLECWEAVPSPVPKEEYLIFLSRLSENSSFLARVSLPYIIPSSCFCDDFYFLSDASYKDSDYTETLQDPPPQPLHLNIINHVTYAESLPPNKETFTNSGIWTWMS